MEAYDNNKLAEDPVNKIKMADAEKEAAWKLTRKEKLRARAAIMKR